MKLYQLIGRKLVLHPNTLIHEDVPLSRLITLDECMRPKEQQFNPNVNYRDSAFERLIAMKAIFTSDPNMDFNLAKRLVKIVCPYCNGETKYTGAGGNNRQFSVDYACIDCGAKISVSFNRSPFEFFPPNNWCIYQKEGCSGDKVNPEISAHDHTRPPYCYTICDFFEE